MENIIKIVDENKEIYLIGTSHVSQESSDLVKSTIATIKPDTVCIELDKTRAEKYTDPKKWSEMDIIKVIKQGKLEVLFFSVIYSAYQRKLADNVGTKAGGDLLQWTHVNKVDRN